MSALTDHDAQAGLDFNRLENVHTVNGKTVTACPACREDGHDRTGDHLIIDEAGRFGCVKYPGPEGADHRRRIFALVGETAPRQTAPRKTPQTAVKRVESWTDAQTAAEACKPCEYSLTDVYDYERNGAAFGWVARYDPEGDGKKRFLQFHPEGDRVAMRAPAGDWPLYLVDGIADGAVYVCEGEKACNAALSIGLNATNSQGGSSAAHKTDWTPLAGQDVVILADNDKDGEKYAAKGAGILLPMGCTVRVLRLPGLPEAGDIFDYLELHPETTAETIEAMAAAVEPETAPTTESEPEQTETPDGYTVRSWGEVAQIHLEPQKWFWGQTFAMGQLQAIIGQGGLGKSRVGLNLARNQVLGRPFAGMGTGNAPLRHLQMGSENSIHRLQHDVKAMSRGLTADQIKLLSEHIFLATIEHPDDAYIALDSDANVERWGQTLAHYKPDVLWVDPYGDIHSGDANSDNETRATLAKITRLARTVNPDCAIVILHHARTGASNVMQAVGFDSANFGKGSKALYSACRAVVNLAPHDETENPPILCACGKNNNAPRFAPVLLTLDPETMTYESEAVDVDAWREEVAAAAKGRRSDRTQQEPLESYHAAVREIVRAEPLPSGTLHTRLKTAIGKGDKFIRNLINDAVFSGVIAKSPRLKKAGGQVLIGLPEGVSALADCPDTPESEA